MDIITLGVLAVLAFAAFMFWRAWQASIKFQSELEHHCLARGWKMERINNIAGSWAITGTASGIPWRLLSAPDENDSDHDWQTLFTAQLPFPPEARMEVLFRMTWTSMQSGLIRKMYEGPLKLLTPANSKGDPFKEMMNLPEVHGVGSPEFSEWFAAAGDPKTAHHLITPEVARLMITPSKMRRPTLSIHGSELKIKPTTHPLKLEEVLAILEIGQIVLRQAASGQRLSA